MQQIMGLPISVHIRSRHLAPTIDDCVTALFADLRRIDRVCSPYRDDSDLARWARGEAVTDPLLNDVVRLCDEAHERTEGWFDPRGLPDPRDGHPRYDPSGLVKGWAVERAARHLADLAGHGWCVNAGGDILVYAPDDQPPWRIGIENPLDPTRVMQVVDLRSGAVATSGSTHRGSHIIDPHTRLPAVACRSVTVTGPSLLWADVYATATAARGTTAVEWLHGVEAYEGLLVTVRGLVRATAGWPGHQVGS
ncbi:FAD:protein FMN transferase [Actinoplanes sp. TBRC 11911]|uniref:FAD:protein FMN transferase n=1 Tax=Actinoplanes sp. TBRC 11911 TaxID=2729386 RepID=UPI00145D9158|nr:FAD:protein FMN transferase [Actinoplanes sp. TBRC 11911]NMO57264.1 FAD:protein FMN transferase [Actinoplanes sp. TBRC 11911]